VGGPSLLTVGEVWGGGSPSQNVFSFFSKKGVL